MRNPPNSNPDSSSNRSEDLTLRQAALTAGFAYLLNPVAYAEAYAYPKLVIPGNNKSSGIALSGSEPCPSRASA